jgi:hypothetical protein
MRKSVAKVSKLSAQRRHRQPHFTLQVKSEAWLSDAKSDAQEDLKLPSNINA